ncbi:Mfs1.1 [Epithele typhae]|uniref:Mfs1.1 n=1 Tax=Epithele typhae TaxID=378194 RepID=UPI002008DD7B|nr:Mfs1.1 [Epithele typhae]KAH9917681.1 Mfs1.1 [Epithele typhae]
MSDADSKPPQARSPSDPPPPPPPKRGWRVWVIFLALCTSTFLAALDLASVSTALPAIIHDLDGTDSFAWVSSAYTLASTAVLPLIGRLADIFGRQRVLLVSILLFAIGSAITGSAPSMNVLIGGRAIQGVGAAGIQVLVSIVTADLIPLKERGIFQAFTNATYAFASVSGPFIGGVIAERTTWRWLFYLNLPLCAISFGVVAVFLQLRRPPVESMRAAFMSMDWIGNAIIITSSTSCIIALTWAGVQFPWVSAPVLLPLIIGVIGFPCAIAYDAYVAEHPVIPLSILNNRTSLGGYLGAFFHGLVINALGFYLPTYFQAAKAASPIMSGLYSLPSGLVISPAAIAQGMLISKTGKYRLINLVGWCLMFLSVGLISMINEKTPQGEIVPFQLILGVGAGLLYATTFTVLAPLEPTQNASALSFLLFVRTITSSWAIAISATILQNDLSHKLPPEFIAMVPGGHDLTYSSIPLIPSLPSPLQEEVRAAFASSLQLVWRVLLAFCAAGTLSVVLQKQIALHSKMDDRWGLKEKEKKDRLDEDDDAEKAGAAAPAPAVGLSIDARSDESRRSRLVNVSLQPVPDTPAPETSSFAVAH